MTTPPPLSAGTSFDSKHDSAIGEDGERSSSASGTPSGSGRVVFDEEYFKANVNRVVTDEWNEMVMECEVTGMPTRDHWKVSFSLILFFSFCLKHLQCWVCWAWTRAGGRQRAVVRILSGT